MPQAVRWYRSWTGQPHDALAKHQEQSETAKVTWVSPTAFLHGNMCHVQQRCLPWSVQCSPCSIISSLEAAQGCTPRAGARMDIKPETFVDLLLLHCHRLSMQVLARVIMERMLQSLCICSIHLCTTQYSEDISQVCGTTIWRRKSVGRQHLGTKIRAQGVCRHQGPTTKVSVQ